MITNCKACGFVDTDEINDWKAIHVKTYTTDYKVTCSKCGNAFWHREWE